LLLENISFWETEKNLFLKKESGWRRPSLILLSFLFLAGFVAGVLAASALSVSSQADYSASPIVKIIPVGQYSSRNITLVLGVNNTVTWINEDVVSHSVTSDTGLFDSGVLGPKQEWSFTFSAPGSYAYHCSLHPWMKGFITVVAQ